MKAVNLMPPVRGKVVASVASFALACSMVPTAGVAWAAEEPAEAHPVTEPAPEDSSDEDAPDTETPEPSNEETPDEQEIVTPEEEPEDTVPPAEDPVEEEESLIDPQLEEPAEATVAEVNGEAFATVKDALAAASAGSAVTLTADATLEGDQFGISKDITLDLGGYTLDLQNALFTTAGTNVTIKNGTIVANGAPKTALIFKGAATLQSVKMQVTGAQPAVKADAGSTVILEKTTISAQADAFVVDGAAALVNIQSGSSVASAQGPAIKVEGKNGGSAKIDVAGTVNGGAGFAIVLTGAGVTEGAVRVTETANGAIVTNGRLAVRCQLPTATLDMQGGTITSAGRGVKMEAGTLNATGTTFNCATPIETAGTGTALVTRGQFKGDVTAFCQTGYAARYDSNTQRFDIVAIGSAVAQIMRESNAILYDDINEALANLQEGDTLNLLANVTVDSSASTNAAAIKLPRLCTLNGNGHTIMAGTFARPSHMINVLAGGVTIKDVTIDMANATNSKHGINVHGSAAWAKIENVTITNANTAAVVVNGSAPQGVTANGLTTSGSGWGAINVDKGGTLILDTIEGLSEPVKVWTEGNGSMVAIPDAAALLAENGMTLYDAPEALAAQAQAVANGVYYESLATAVEAAQAEGVPTVQVTRDIQSSESALGVVDISGVVLDLDGHTIFAKNFSLIFQGSDAKICNGSFDALGGAYALFVGDEGVTERFVVEDVMLKGGINVYNASEVALRNVAAEGTSYYAIWCDENAHVTVESGTYASAGVAVIGMSATDTELFIKGGTFDDTNTKTPGSMVLQGDYNVPQISGGTFTSDVSEYCVPGKAWENGVIVDEVTEPETPETPVTPVPNPQQPVAPAPSPQPQQPVTPSTPDAVQNTGAGVRFAPVVAAEEAAEEMGLVAPTEAAAQAFQSTESIQDAETPMAKEPTAVVAEDQTGIDWRTITGATIVVLLAAGGLLAALCRRKGQESS